LELELATDLKGHIVGDMLVRSMSVELLKSTKTVVNFSSSSEGPRRERVEKAASEVKSKKKTDDDKDMESSKGWVKQLVDFLGSFRKEKPKGGEESKDIATGIEAYLTRIAAASDKIVKDCSLWVGICDISSNAQKKIAQAIKMSDCCGAVSASAGKGADKASNAATATTKSTATGGKPLVPTAATVHTVTAALPSDVAASTTTTAGKDPVKTGKSVTPKSTITPITPKSSATSSPTYVGSPPTSAGRGGGGGGGTGGAGPSISPPGGPIPSSAANGMAAAAGAAKALGAAFTVVYGKMVQVMDIDPFKHVFTGVISESNNFRENLRQILHQQQGFTAENRAAEESYKNITSSVMATGLRRGEFMNVWLKNLQRGYVMEGKGDKGRELAVNRMKSAMTTAASTARSLDMDVNSTNEMFMDWHQHLALSVNDLAEMGRHMQGVARNTGVTGKELEKAMGSAAKVTKSLQDAGLASVKAMKSVTQMAAISQKHGVGDQMANIQTALSGADSFFSADMGTKTLIQRSSQNAGIGMEQVMSGAVSQDPELQRKLYGGMEQDMRRFMDQTAGSALANMGMDAKTMDLTKLNETIQKLGQVAATSTDMNERNTANNALIAMNRLSKSQMGVGVGQLQGMARSIDENKLTSGQRLEKMQGRLSEAKAAGRGGLDETKQLEKQVTEAKSGASLDAITELQRTLNANKVGSVSGLNEDAKKSLEGRLKEGLGDTGAKDFMKDIGASTQELMGSLTQRAEASGLNFANLAKEKGYDLSKLQTDLQKGGQEGEVALAALNEIQQKIGRKERESQDPITFIRGKLTDINTKLGELVDGAFFKLTNGIAQVVFWVGQAVAILGSIWGVVSLFNMASSIASGVGSVSSMLGAAGTTAGVGAAGTAGAGAAAAGTTAVGSAAAGTGAVGAGTSTATGGAAAAAGGVGMSAIAGMIAAPLMMIYGAVKGSKEAKEANRTTGEGVALGMLTGGAKTGSMFSGALGIQKGGVADKAAGVVGGAAWGAAAGTAIGAALAPFTAGISIPVAALIGGLVGAVAELIKIFTEGTNLFQRFFVRPFEALIKGIGDILKGVWDIVAGIFTLDISRIGGGISKILGGILHIFVDLVKWAFDAIISFCINIPNMIIGAVKSVFLEFPAWISGLITSALQSLANNEYIGPIFKPILALWESIRNIGTQIYNFVAPILDAIVGAWNKVRDAIMGVLDPLLATGGEGSFLAGVFGVLGSVIKAVATVIGWLVTAVLWPFTKAFEAIGWVVGLAITGIKAVWKWFEPIFSSIGSTLYKIGQIFYYIGAIVGALVVKAWSKVSPIFERLGEAAGVVSKKWNEFLVWIEPLTWALGKAFEVVGGAMLWWLNVIWWPFGEALSFVGDMIMGIVQIVNETVDSVLGWFKWLYDKLVGHSIITDLVFKVIELFALWPIYLLKAIGSLIPVLLKGIGTFLSSLPSLFMSTMNSLLGGLPSVIFGVLDSVLGGIPGKIAGVFSGAIESIGKTLSNVGTGWTETNEQANTRIEESGYSMSHGVGRMGGGALDAITGGEGGIFGIKSRIEAVKKVFGGLWETMGGGFTSLRDTALSALGLSKENLSKLYDNVAGWFSGMGKWFDEATGGMGTYLGELWDGFGNWLGEGIASVKEMFNNAISSVTGFFTGLFTSPGETLSKAMDGAAGIMESIGGGISSGISSAASAISNSSLNPLNWFEEGTREINKGGLAVLHEGEMIIPKEVWDQIKALGTGSFGSGGDVKDSFGGILGDVGKMLTDNSPSLGGMVGNIGSTISGLLGGKGTAIATTANNWMGSLTGGVAGMFGLGKESKTEDSKSSPSMKGLSVFSDSLNAIELLFKAVTFIKDILVKHFGSTSVSDQGAFAPDEAKDAIDQGVNATLKYISTDNAAYDKLARGSLGGIGADDVDEMIKALDKIDKSSTKEVMITKTNLLQTAANPIGKAKEVSKTLLSSETIFKDIQKVFESTTGIDTSGIEEFVIDLSDMDGLEVHDAALEDVLKSVLSIGGENVKEITQIGPALLGAFGKGEVDEAMVTNVTTDLKKASLGIMQSIDNTLPKEITYLKNLASSIGKEDDGDDLIVDALEPLMEIEELVLQGKTMVDLLKGAFGSVKPEEISTDVTMSLLGAFAPQEGTEAFDMAQSATINQLISSSQIAGGSLGGIVDSLKQIVDSFSEEKEKPSWLESIIKLFTSGGTSLISNTVGGSLSNAFSTMTSDSSKSVGNVIGGKGFGLFAPDQVEEAKDQSASNYMQQMIWSHAKGLGESASLHTAMLNRAKAARGMASQMGAGLFSKEDNVSEANDESVNNVVTQNINRNDLGNILAYNVKKKQDEQKKSRIFADVTRALSYDQSASEAANNVTGNKAEASGAGRGEVATNAIDYSDALTGTVSTLLTNRETVENHLERERAGTQDSSISLLPSMDAIHSYLTSDQAGKFDDMINLLKDIRSNTERRGGGLSEIIGPISEGVLPMTGVGVKPTALGSSRGSWDLVFGDTSPGNVTTEGRGSGGIIG
jgi:phage-related protein